MAGRLDIIFQITFPFSHFSMSRPCPLSTFVDISLALRRQNGSSDGEILQTCGIFHRGAYNSMRGLVLVFSADVSAAWGA
jgi:hypothetical protein